MKGILPIISSIFIVNLYRRNNFNSLEKKAQSLIINSQKRLVLFVFFLSLFNTSKNIAQVGILTGTGHDCETYSFTICPNNAITPFNYSSFTFSCPNTVAVTDVSFNVLGSPWRVSYDNWNFTANVNGQLSGSDGSGANHIYTFIGSDIITPQSYSGGYIQFAINGVSTGILPLNQTTFSISINPVTFSGNSYIYCPSSITNIAISPVLPSQGGPWTYNLNPGGISTIPATVNPTTSTIYTLTATSTGGCVSTTTLAVIITPMPLIIAATPTIICNGQSSLLTASGATNYTWSANAGSSITSTVSVSPTTGTTYTVIGDNSGCISSAEVTIDISAPMSINIVTPNDTICPGKTKTLTAITNEGVSSYTLTWLPVNAHENLITVNPTTTTIYTVNAIDECSSSATATVEVAIAALPLVSFNANPIIGCQNVCTTIAGISSSLPGNNVVSYSWNFGDGQTGNGINASHCYNTIGNYNITLYGITQKGCKDSLTLNNLIYVYPKPTANYYDISPSFETDANTTTISFFDVSSGNDIIAWDWLFLPGETSSSKNPTYTFVNDETYPVRLVVSNSEGCHDTIIKDIIINPNYSFYVPNAFSPNGDGLNDMFKPTGAGWDLTTYNFWIFDRWGLLFYHTQDTNAGWSGTKNGEILQEDIYIWKVELTDIFKKTHQYNGQVSVIR